MLLEHLIWSFSSYELLTAAFADGYYSCWHCSTLLFHDDLGSPQMLWKLRPYDKRNVYTPTKRAWQQSL